MDIKYRLFQQEDLKQLGSLIYSVWQLDKMCGSEEKGRLFSKEYLYDVLKETTKLYIAQSGEKIVGMIALSIASQKTFDVDSNVEHRYQMILNHYHDNCLKLLQQSHTQYDGEVVLFVVAKDYQKKGIGHHLWALAINEFKYYRCHNYFLYTDTSCDYEYYQRHGMKRVTSLKTKPKDDFELYLYEGSLDKQL